MLRNICLISVVALTFAGCNQRESSAAPEAATTIHPNDIPDDSPAIGVTRLTAEGLGSIRIGQTLAELEAVAGGPPTPLEDADACNFFSPVRGPQGVYVLTEGGQVTRITLRENASARTDRGFGLGEEAATIKEAFGGGVVAQPAKYAPAPAEDLFVWSRGGSTAHVTDPEARGIRYEVGPNGKVQAIHAGGPAIQLVENCG